MAQSNIMTVASLRFFLNDFGSELLEQYEVWLSSDPEGNLQQPMQANPEKSVTLDLERKRLILFPFHNLDVTFEREYS